MLNALLAQLRAYDMVSPGDKVVCAVSGGADSMALLWGMYLLREKLGVTLEAAHFNHGLRGEESDRDQAFVQEVCARLDLPLTLGRGKVVPGKKGLEAAAREARYGFLLSLEGKIATAHTADDNLETVLMHLLRGTGLKGLGGIAPVNGRLIRPLLTVTRQNILNFLQEYSVDFVEDSSNSSDVFLRNRLRHGVVPLLKAENPRLAQAVSAMAMDLRRDEATLAAMARREVLPTVPELRTLAKALRCRVLEDFLKKNGVREPERAHIALAEALVFSEKPSAEARFPGGLVLRREYDRLVCASGIQALKPQVLPVPGAVLAGGWRISAEACQTPEFGKTAFSVQPVGQILVRSRRSGDEMRLPGGTKTLKKLFADRKIPAAERPGIPVLCDDQGVLCVPGVGGNLARRAEGGVAVTLRWTQFDRDGSPEK